jgi:hypothetical protein
MPAYFSMPVVPREKVHERLREVWMKPRKRAGFQLLKYGKVCRSGASIEIDRKTVAKKS